MPRRDVRIGTRDIGRLRIVVVIEQRDKTGQRLVRQQHRIVAGIAAQEALAAIGEEVLATSKLPLAIGYKRAAPQTPVAAFIGEPVQGAGGAVSVSVGGGDTGDGGAMTLTAGATFVTYTDDKARGRNLFQAGNRLPQPLRQTQNAIWTTTGDPDGV